MNTLNNLMKKLVLFLFVSLMFSQVYGQLIYPTHWTFTVDQTKPGEATLIFNINCSNSFFFAGY